MKASKFLNIFIPVLAGTSIAAVPAGIYIGNQGIFHFQVQVSSLDDCATLNNTGATVGRDFVTTITLKEGYTIDSFDVVVGGKRLSAKAYAYAPKQQRLIIYGNYITSQDLSITVNTISRPVGRSFEEDSWENVVNYCNGSFEEMQRHYGRTSFVGLERTLMVTIEGTTFPYRVLVVGEQEDYMEYHDNKFTNPCALTFEFQNALSPSDGVEEKFYYSAQQKPQRSRWDESIIKKSIDKALQSGIKEPSLLQQNGIKTVYKKTYSGIDGVKPSIGQNWSFLPSIFEYFSIDGIKRSTQGIKTYFISGNAENEAPQYSYYQDKFNNACPEDKAILKQFYRYPIVVDSQRIIRPVSYWLRSAVNDSLGAVAVNAQRGFGIYECYAGISQPNIFGACPMFCI